MPRAKKDDPFFIKKNPIKIKSEGESRFAGTNNLFEGDPTDLTLERFIDFLKEHGVDPKDVRIAGTPYFFIK